jgi:hypothetical protein
MKKTIPYILFLLLITAGCGTDSRPATGNPVTGAPGKGVAPTEPCRFCGQDIPEGTALASPLLVVLDNAAPARPQSGLPQACLVYEVPVEGGLTRLLAVFGRRFTGEIGPVRSVRPYFAILTLEHGGILAYCGASPRGEAALRELRVAHLNEITNSRGFFRRSERRAPYNLYTDLDHLLAAAKRRKIPTAEKRDPVFNTGPDAPIGGESAVQLQIAYSGEALVEYVFDRQSGLYLRSVNGKPHRDDGGSQLAARNLVVQFVNIRPEETASERLDLSLAGRGEGYYFAGGQVFPLTWDKKSAAAPTRYTVNGSKLVFSPGTTWIHLVSARGRNSVLFH